MTSGPAKWAEEVKGLYEDDIVPGYIKAMVSPMRSTYATEKMKNAEMLKTLTNVGNLKIQKMHSYFQLIFRLKLNIMHLRETLQFSTSSLEKLQLLVRVLPPSLKLYILMVR